jgi:hypothetical protein
MKKRIIHHVFNLTITPGYWWERLILLFCRTYTLESPLVYIEYKYFYDRLYITKQTPAYFECVWPPNPNGIRTPWMN